jgi:hypothetical protein
MKTSKIIMNALIGLLITASVQAATTCRPYQSKDDSGTCVVNIDKLGKYLHIRFDCDDDSCTGQRIEGVSSELNMPEECELTDTLPGSDKGIETRLRTDYYDCGIGISIAIETWKIDTASVDGEDYESENSDEDIDENYEEMLS